MRFLIGVTTLFLLLLIATKDTRAGSLEQATMHLFQRTPSADTYFGVNTAVYFSGPQGEERKLDGVLAGSSFMYQSGEYLLTYERGAFSNLQVFQRGEVVKTIGFYTDTNISIMDYRPDYLYLAGFSEDQTEMTFQCLDGNGHTRQQLRLPFENKTPFRRDDNRMSALLDKDRWLVWVPAALSMLVFDLELKLVDLVAVPIPEDLINIGDIEQILYQEPSAEMRQQACEALVGKTITALPPTLLVLPDGIGIPYLCATLTGCGDLKEVRTHDPVQTRIRTELVLLDKDGLQVIGRKRYDDRYIFGFFGSPNRVCGKQQKGTTFSVELWQKFSWR